MENKAKDNSIYYGIGAIALCTLGIIGIRMYRSKTGETSSSVNPAITATIPAVATVSIFKSLFTNDNFPLKENSKGERVKKLQEALKKIQGNEVLESDGKFKTATIAALKKAGLPVVIDEATYNNIIQPKPLVKKAQGEFNPEQLSNALKKYSKEKNIQGVISVLQQMDNPADYQLVNEKFSYQPWYDPTTAYTIVTDLLQNAFPEVKNPKKTAEKKQMQDRERVVQEFRRIKLKWNKATQKFSLQGLNENVLITIADTHIDDGAGNKIRVKGNTILGPQQYISNGKAFFKALDSKIYSVPNRDIKYR